MTALASPPEQAERPTNTAVLGDGTSIALRVGRRWRASRLVLLVLLSGFIAALVVAGLTPEQSSTRFAADNSAADGGMALAQVLGDQGVEIRATSSISEAIQLAGPGITLLIANDYGMTPDLAASLVGTGADIVLVAPGPDLLGAASGDVKHARRSPDTSPVVASCEDPDAQAAEQVSTDGARFTTVGEAPGVAVCFPDASGAGHYAVFPLASDPAVTVRALDSASGLINSAILTAGNAALGLRMLGHQDTLIWLIPDRPVAVAESDEPQSLLPPWAGPVGFQLLLVVIVAALWRGRRLGPLATEDLPVVVLSSETVRGRGRLYRRARAFGHAGAALRAGAADRIAARLGLPRSASPQALVDATARASGRPPGQVSALLYGPPPIGDVELTRLATDLDTLESEVHHL